MTTGQLQRDRPVQEEAAVELVAARDAADAAAEADKAARRAAAEAERSARQAAKQAARAEKAAKSLGGRRRRRWRVWRWFPAQPSAGEPVELEIVTFSDLVRAHRAWEQELYEHERHNRQPDKAIEREFRRKWRQFEGRYGRIDDAYWSVRDASAVAFTIRQKHSRWRPDPELIPRFHRTTDWATRDEPDIAAALDECETLAVRVEEILRGPSELIALRRINAVASHLLGFVDREWELQFRRSQGVQRQLDGREVGGGVFRFHFGVARFRGARHGLLIRDRFRLPRELVGHPLALIAHGEDRQLSRLLAMRGRFRCFLRGPATFRDRRLRCFRNDRALE